RNFLESSAMSHPDMENTLPFTPGVLHLLDEHGVPVAVFLVQGTFAIGPGGLTLHQEQHGIHFGGVRNVDVEVASYKYEPQYAFYKPATDVALVGHAYNLPRAPAVDVRLRLAALDKTVRVLGDRFWVKSMGSIDMTPGESFDRIPLIY